MCVSLTLKLFGATLFFQGCATMEPISLPRKAEPPAVILFRDAQANLVRAAVAACGEGTPREREGEVLIVRVEHKGLTSFSVGCADPPKVM